jgi:malate dehydrogenase
MKASAMELHDCVFPLLNSLKSSLTYEDGFKGCELAILVGAKPRGPGMERKDLLGENAMIFREQGKAIDAFASKNCKVLVVGNPANTNCLIVSKFAPSIPKENFSALTRLDENRAVFQLAEKTGVKPYCVYDMIIWGNHSSTQVPDYHNVKIEKNGELVPLETLVTDKAWL